VQGVLGAFGRRAYRRALTPEELARWTQVSSDLSAGDAWRGLQYAVSGILQSPHFLDRVELGEPDPSDPTRRARGSASRRSASAIRPTSP